MGPDDFPSQKLTVASSTTMCAVFKEAAMGEKEIESERETKSKFDIEHFQACMEEPEFGVGLRLRRAIEAGRQKRVREAMENSLDDVSRMRVRRLRQARALKRATLMELLDERMYGEFEKRFDTGVLEWDQLHASLDEYISKTKAPKCVHHFVIGLVVDELLKIDPDWYGGKEEHSEYSKDYIAFWNRLWSLCPDSENELREAIWDVGGFEVLSPAANPHYDPSRVREEVMKLALG